MENWTVSYIIKLNCGESESLLNTSTFTLKVYYLLFYSFTQEQSESFSYSLLADKNQTETKHDTKMRFKPNPEESVLLHL